MFNNLPTQLQNVIQQGWLEREMRESLRANLGFRAIADREPFPAAIGETVTKTRRGLLTPALTPISTPANSDLTSGLTPNNYSVEQYILGISQYADTMQLNMVSQRVAIVPIFLQNVAAQAEQAARTMDILAQRALFNAYMGGQTRVRTTLGAAAATISVDDIRGFQYFLNYENAGPNGGTPQPVSSSNKMVVTINGNSYNLQGATADGSNVSTAPNGVSGTLTFDANVTTTDGTAGNSVISSVAPSIIRPYNATSGVMAGNTSLINPSTMGGATLTVQMVLQAKAQLRLNNVLPMPDGRFNLYADPAHLTGIYQDPAFQRFFTGREQASEYRNGVVGELLGVKVIETNLNPVQNLGGVGNVRRAILCGQGALVEGEFTRTAYAEAMGVQEDPAITVVDGVAHITREPLDVLKQVVQTSWTWIGGFVVPTDMTANPTVIPTATNSAYKRAVIVESL